MGKEIKLAAKIRTSSSGKAGAIRRGGHLPAVLYGPSSDTAHLVLKTVEFCKVLEQAGESTLVELEIEGGKLVKALIQDVQLEPIKRRPIHVDLYQVDMQKAVTTEIPLVFTGEAPAVKELGAFVVKSMDAIEVTCLPGNLVGSIEVNLAALKTLEDMITVKDLRLPQGIVPTADQDEAVATVTLPEKEDEKTPIATEEAQKEETKGEK